MYGVSKNIYMALNKLDIKRIPTLNRRKAIFIDANSLRYDGGLISRTPFFFFFFTMLVSIICRFLNHMQTEL
jgi:hypothetical protein